MIEFPETLEEITVWAMEHAGDNTISFYSRAWRNNTREMASGLVYHQIRAWLTRIAQLEGAVTHEQQPWPDTVLGQYRVSVAGIFVCVLSEVDLTAIYNGELSEH
jgi:hypothetical protein